MGVLILSHQIAASKRVSENQAEKNLSFHFTSFHSRSRNAPARSTTHNKTQQDTTKHTTSHNKTQHFLKNSALSTQHSLLFHHLSALHNEFDMLQQSDVFQRVPIHRDDVRKPARFDRSDIIGRVQQSRRVYCGRLDRLHRLHTISHHEGEFLGLV